MKYTYRHAVASILVGLGISSLGVIAGAAFWFNCLVGAMGGYILADLFDENRKRLLREQEIKFKEEEIKEMIERIRSYK